MCRESHYRITVSTFGGQPSPDITNRDGPQAAIVLAKCYHIPAKQNGSNLSGASTAEQQVHEVSQGLNQRTTCISKSHQVQQMARSKAVGATGRSGRERTDRSKHFSWGNLPCIRSLRGGQASNCLRVGVQWMSFL